MATKDIESAVRAAQLYIGCGTTTRIADQQRLYNRMTTKIAAVAKRRKMDTLDAHDQIVKEAKRRGGICPLPGKDL